MSEAKKKATKSTAKKAAVKDTQSVGNVVDLKKFYRDEVITKLKDALGLDNVMQVPKITKITLNVSSKNFALDKKKLEKAVAELSLISGRKPVVTKARKSIAGFKIREGFPIGCKVTLRGDRMYQWLNQLIKIVIPRIRDFRGLSKFSFDGRGNYSFGIKEQVVFPEIKYEEVDELRGMDICISTTAANDQHAFALLKSFNFPFKE